MNTGSEQVIQFMELNDSWEIVQLSNLLLI